ncbi:MAG: hypothetical protein ACI9MR_000979, partial [Myxococcota bacterium]
TRTLQQELMLGLGRLVAIGRGGGSAFAIAGGTSWRRRQLVLTPVGRASFWLSRLAPSTYQRMMLKKQGAPFGLAS